MIVFATFGGYGPPAPWLQIILGSGMIVYWVYRLRKTWHTIGGGEFIAALIICVGAGLFVFQGVRILLNQ